MVGAVGRIIPPPNLHDFIVAGYAIPVVRVGHHQPCTANFGDAAEQKKADFFSYFYSSA